MLPGAGTCFGCDGHAYIQPHFCPEGTEFMDSDTLVQMQFIFMMNVVLQMMKRLSK